VGLSVIRIKKCRISRTSRLLWEFARNIFGAKPHKLLGEDYFEHLLAEIREIRLSERRFYQKITDLYATSLDYNKEDAPVTKEANKLGGGP
jgi:hypothetical protein